MKRIASSWPHRLKWHCDQFTRTAAVAESLLSFERHHSHWRVQAWADQAPPPTLTKIGADGRDTAPTPAEILPTRRHRTATVFIGKFQLGEVGLGAYAKCFFSQSSESNELIFNTMLYAMLKGSTRILIRFVVSECDDFEHCDVTSMTS